MTRRGAMGLMAAWPLAFAQDAVPDYVCPMDPDVRSTKPGSCPRCGMKLLLGIPDGLEYPMDVTLRPRVFRAGDKVQVEFRIRDPKSGKAVEKFEVVHERLFHLFVVSRDLGYFLHDHPVLGTDGVFRFEACFPKPGLYRILGDFFPGGATPQLIARTIIVPGRRELGPVSLAPSHGPAQAESMEVELRTEPSEPIAGAKTLLFFRLKPGDGMEKYLGAWGHMLAASDDLIDMIHTHPFLADGGDREQFNLIFPRARTYRIWVQFQRRGVVNTAAFNVPVSELK